MRHLIEGKIPAGCIHQPIYRPLHRLWRRFTGKRHIKGMGVDWTTGSPWRSYWQNKLPHKNQGTNDSCGGQSASEGIQVERLTRGIDEGELSAKSYYAPIAFSGGGTTITALMTQVGAHGGNLEKAVPSYDVYGNPLQEYLMAELSWQTPDMVQNALTRAGYTPFDIADDIETVAEAIQDNKFVIWAITGQNNGTWMSANPQPPSKDNPNPKWHHFMCAYDYGIVNGQKVIYAMQSEGPTWGDNGIQYFTEPYFNSGYVDAIKFIYDLNLVPNTDNHSIWAEINRWFQIYFKQLSPA